MVEVREGENLDMRVHYKGWANKFDEHIPITDELLDVKYAEIGKYSCAYGQAKFPSRIYHKQPPPC